MNRKPLLAALLLMPAVVRADLRDDALNALHDAGEHLTTLAADVALHDVSTDTGEDTVRTGTVVLQRLPDGDGKIRVTFTRTVTGKAVDDARQDVLLDGPTLVTRDSKAKKETTRVVRQPGEKLNLFKLGEGPFPLPVGQSRDDVLKEFDVKAAPPKNATDLAVLTLTPKDKTPLAERFSAIEVTVDRQTRLPLTIKTTDREATEVKTAVLTHPRENETVKEEEFRLGPLPAGYETVK